MGEIKVFFVESLNKPAKIKYQFRENSDITVNSILIATEIKIIGFIKHVFKPINCVLRSSHPVNDVSELEILSSIQEGRKQTQNNIKSYIKLTHTTRLKRYEKLKSKIITQIISQKNKTNNIIANYDFKKEKNGTMFFNKFFKINLTKIFIAKQFYRFVLHLY